MANDNALTTRQGALFVQPDGPNTAVHFLGCHDLGDISQPISEPTILRCMNPGGGWKTVGQTNAPPENITTSIENMSFLTADWLDKLKGCLFNLLVLQRSGGDADLISNWARARILFNAQITNISESNLVHHEEESAVTISRDISAWPPLLRMNLLSGKVRNVGPSGSGYFPTPVDNAAVFFTSQLNCESRENPGKYGWIATKAPAGGTANVLFTEDYGVTWSPTGSDPFGADVDITDIVAFSSDGTNYRILVSAEPPPGGQGKVAYSDDVGESWIVVNIGGATDGHGAIGGNGMFVIDSQHIWLGSVDGFLYFTADGGETWTAYDQESLMDTEDIVAVFFADEDEGMAVGGADKMLFTGDGGASWVARSLGNGDGILCVWKAGDIWWVGTDAGQIFYSTNDGATWTLRGGWSGSGVGEIQNIVFSNEMIGFFAVNNGADSKLMLTITGGTYWAEVPIPPMLGINDLSVADTNFAFFVGPIVDSDGMATKVDDE